MGLLGGLVAGCSLPVARNLDDSNANRIVLALQEGGVAATKEADSQNEGRWSVTVQRADVTEALGIVSRQGLPERERPGIAESATQNALIPSLRGEQAQLLAATAADLERTLRSIDGVVSARVHLALVSSDPLAEAMHGSAPSASVLIRYRGARLPVDVDSVKRLVSGSVADLAPEHVAVLTSQVAPVLPAQPRKTVPLGPFLVARGSAPGLRLLIAGLAALNLLTLTQLLLFWRQVRKVGRSPTTASRPSVSP